MTLLELVQEFCRRTGIAIPTQVATSIDPQVLQFMGLVNEIVEDVIESPAGEVWQGVDQEATFVTVAAEDQGALNTLAPLGFLNILNGTVYSRSRQLPSYGPLSAQEWQQLKAMVMTGPFYKYRIWQNHLFLYPAPPAGETYAFEYNSNFAVIGADLAYKRYFTADDDTFVIIPDILLLRGLRWKWKKEKGLEYDEEFREYQILLSRVAGRDKTNSTLYMDSPSNSGMKPGIWISPGSWNIP